LKRPYFDITGEKLPVCVIRRKSKKGQVQA